MAATPTESDSWTGGTLKLGNGEGWIFDIAIDADLLAAPYGLRFHDEWETGPPPPIAVAFYDLEATGAVPVLGHVELPEPGHLDGLPLVDLDDGMAYVVAAHGDVEPPEPTDADAHERSLRPPRVAARVVEGVRGSVFPPALPPSPSSPPPVRA